MGTKTVTQDKRKVTKLYLHWTATRPDWAEPGHYHAVTDNLGVTRRLTPYDQHQGGSTYNRNKNAISIAMACMATKPDGGYEWPTEKQIDGFCKEAAKIALGLNWLPDEKFLEHRIMTHAEAAANRDYPVDLVEKFSQRRPSSDWDHAAQDAGLPHANYGPSIWLDGWPGGDVVRWDLWKLRDADRMGAGGYELRKRIVAWMEKISEGLPKGTRLKP
jgi:hypothetical protein